MRCLGSCVSVWFVGSVSDCCSLLSSVVVAVASSSPLLLLLVAVAAAVPVGTKPSTRMLMSPCNSQHTISQAMYGNRMDRLSGFIKSAAAVFCLSLSALLSSKWGKSHLPGSARFSSPSSVSSFFSCSSSGGSDCDGCGGCWFPIPFCLDGSAMRYLTNVVTASSVEK